MNDQEQLAKIMNEHFWVDTYTCACGANLGLADTQINHTAQAIINAGWTAPETLISHNHFTREIKPTGQCEACDTYHIQ